MVQRLTYRRRHPYNTRSNRVRKVKTPGRKTVPVKLSFFVLSYPAEDF